jgi:DNA-binding response OmpR family regulator
MATIFLIEDKVEIMWALKSYLKQAGLVVFAAYRGDPGLGFSIARQLAQAYGGFFISHQSS